MPVSDAMESAAQDGVVEEPQLWLCSVLLFASPARSQDDKREAAGQSSSTESEAIHAAY